MTSKRYVLLLALGGLAFAACGGAVARDNTVGDGGDADDGGADSMSMRDGSLADDGSLLRDGSTDVIGDGTIGDTTVPCDPSTCSTGCCDGNGICRPGSASTTCGTGGQACTDCSANGSVCVADGGVCIAPTATCDPQNCNGCCQGNACRSGTDITACGQGGVACFACPVSEACANGSCTPPSSTCGPQSCVGCCVAGTCYLGEDDHLCGQGGETCQNCPANCVTTGDLGGGRCADGSACSPGTCAGCCDGFGNCHPGTDNIACGGGGNPCAVCSDAGVCAGNACTLGSCNLSNCDPGCCDDLGTCHPTTDLQHCGQAGDPCAACPSGYVCDVFCRIGPLCGPSNCPNGCCDVNGLCATGQDGAACGTGGNACVACTGGQQCLLNTCQ